MERMVDFLPRLRARRGEEQPEPSDLASLLDEIATSARRQGHAVSLMTSGDLAVPLRPQAMKRCIDNLVANATRHAAQVEIKAQRLNRAIEVTIDDDGPGIPPESREDVFKPFVRLDKSRNTSTGGGASVSPSRATRCAPMAATSRSPTHRSAGCRRRSGCRCAARDPSETLHCFITPLSPPLRRAALFCGERSLRPHIDSRGGLGWGVRRQSCVSSDCARTTARHSAR